MRDPFNLAVEELEGILQAEHRADWIDWPVSYWARQFLGGADLQPRI